MELKVFKNGLLFLCTILLENGWHQALSSTYKGKVMSSVNLCMYIIRFITERARVQRQIQNIACSNMTWNSSDTFQRAKTFVVTFHALMFRPCEIMGRTHFPTWQHWARHINLRCKRCFMNNNSNEALSLEMRQNVNKFWFLDSRRTLVSSIELANLYQDEQSWCSDCKIHPLFEVRKLKDHENSGSSFENKIIMIFNIDQLLNFDDDETRSQFYRETEGDLERLEPDYRGLGDNYGDDYGDDFDGHYDDDHGNGHNDHYNDDDDEEEEAERDEEGELLEIDWEQDGDLDEGLCMMFDFERDVEEEVIWEDI